MLINANLSRRAVVNAPGLPWIDSPLPGVQRRMLERDGGEVARATSIVRYAPGSFFDAHIHDAGEEFLVLEGVFSDESGDFHAGMYVRNPPGSRHRPFTRDGCTILVKLRQFDVNDRDYVRIDTGVTPWQPGSTRGLHVMPLHECGSERVTLVKWDKGARRDRHVHPLGAEIYVISGVLADEFGRYPAGTWIRSPAGSAHGPWSDTGCVCYLKTGHL